MDKTYESSPIVSNSFIKFKTVNDYINFSDSYKNLSVFMESLNLDKSSYKFHTTTQIQEITLSESGASTSGCKFLSSIDDHYDQDSEDDSSDDGELKQKNSSSISTKTPNPFKLQLNKNVITPNEFTTRKLPPRKTKDEFLHSCKRRVIKKPKKNNYHDIELKLNDIKKLYLNQKCKIKTSNLETIYEEPQHNKNGDIHLIGTKKLRRSIKLSNGLQKNKTIIKNRKERIKKLFGKNKRKPIKLTLNDVLDKLNRNIENNLN